MRAASFWLLRTAVGAFFRRVRRHAGPTAPPVVSPDVDSASVAAGHEITDIAPRGLFLFGLALVLSVLVVLGVTLFYFRWLGRWERRENADRPRHEPAAASLVSAGRDYAGPLLQIRPENDLRAMRASTDDELSTYRWLDRPAGVVRLPIERAMDLVAARGLPPVSPGKTAVQIQQERALPENRLDDRRQPQFVPSSPPPP